MNISVTKKPKSLISLAVEIPWDEVQPYLERAAKEYSEKAAVPGFRKGQVPYAVILQRLGIEALLDLALETLVSHTYMKGLMDHKLETVGAPQVDIKARTPRQPVRYEAVVAAVPEVALGEIGKLSVARKAVVITEEETDKLLAELQRMRATEREVAEPAAKGHKVTMSYRLLQDNVPLEGSSAADTDIVLGETQVLPGFSEHIIGMKAGEEKKFPVRFPDTWSRKDLAGRTAEVELQLKKVAAIDLPPVDDAFAASLGTFKTAQELKDKMRENIKLEKEDAEERRVGSAAVEALVKASTFGELPDILIEGELDRMIEEISHEVTHYGVSFDDWLKKINKTKEGIRKEHHAQAAERVKASLVLRALAKDRDIVPEEKELLEEVEKVLRQVGGDPAAQERIRTHAFHEYLKNQIVTRKTVEWLKRKIVK
jgi:trigger factor